LEKEKSFCCLSTQIKYSSKSILHDLNKALFNKSSEQKPRSTQNDSDEHESKGRKARNAQQAINVRNFTLQGIYLVPLIGHPLKIKSDSTAVDFAAQSADQQCNPLRNEPMALAPQKAFAPS